MKPQLTLKANLLVDKLTEIGYSIRYCGCDIFQIKNDKNRLTAFFIEHNKLYLDEDKIFNQDRRSKKYGTLGAIVFDVEKAKITHYKKDQFVSVRNGKAFINFRPHSK